MVPDENRRAADIKSVSTGSAGRRYLQPDPAEFKR